MLRPHQIDSLEEVIVPTGGGKTMYDQYQFKSAPQTIVVVAPRILLAKQLCSEFREMIDIHPDDVLHVHSGETKYYSTTDSTRISVWSAKKCAF